jgi:hypothetical protein
MTIDHISWYDRMMIFEAIIGQCQDKFTDCDFMNIPLSATDHLTMRMITFVTARETDKADTQKSTCKTLNGSIYMAADDQHFQRI